VGPINVLSIVEELEEELEQKFSARRKTRKVGLRVPMTVLQITAFYAV
jgi:hypothetical protein